MGRFFTDSFNRRTGQAAGDRGGRCASRRPRGSRCHRSGRACCSTPRRQRAPWVSEADIRAKGAIVVGRSPMRPHSAGAFACPVSDLVPEVPRAFERAV